MTGRRGPGLGVPLGDWIFQGACRGLPTDLFFPEREADAEEPKAICRSCPVLVPCLAYAMGEPSVGGVWGATSERDRRRLRRARRRSGR
jgi:WhiB family redox-sensing transcriptional regulator